MDAGARETLELRMNDVDRIVASIVRSDIPLDRAAVTRAAALFKPNDAPIAPHRIIHDVADAVVGLGPLETLLRDSSVSDVLVNGAADIWIERDGVVQRTDVRFQSDEAVVTAVRRAIAPLGLRLDRAVPAVDARLPDGSRLHAIIPPASVDGPIVAIRRFLQAVSGMEDLVARGAIAPGGVEILENLVAERRNILVAGGTGAGKTTMLNVLAGTIATGDRIVTIEDAAELKLSGHVVRLEAHPPNVEGNGEITVRSLLKYALRLRPDRIIVGEVRGVEAADMIQALNTGHAGSMSTIHANSAPAALDRLEILAGQLGGSMANETVRQQILSAVDFVVYVGRDDGLRVVQSIHRVDGGGLEAIYQC
jgi:pilus assembly protein CpaF